MEKKSIYVIYDRNVESFALKIAEGRPSLAIIADEEHKTMDTVLAICRWLLAQGANRDAIVWAVGGGVTTDLVGFAASIYKRGVRYANYPTTLLSQVDAGVGGKTGVNLDGYKNMLGVFRMPEVTFLCADVLRTLPRREFLSGLAELLKTFLLADADAYAAALSGVNQDLITKAARIKADIVERDPYEKGERAKLNLGHTFGHAIEKCSTRYEHGEAVAIGIVMAARLAADKGLLDPETAARIRADFQAVGLPVEPPVPEAELRAAMLQDKKRSGSSLCFVLPERIGKATLWEESVTA